MRAKLDQTTVTEYAEALTAGQTLPPIVLFHDGAVILAGGRLPPACRLEACLWRARPAGRIHPPGDSR